MPLCQTGSTGINCSRTGTGIASFPFQHAAASGIAPVRPCWTQVPVGLGVDGSASNDPGICCRKPVRPCCCNGDGDASAFSARDAMDGHANGRTSLGKERYWRITCGMQADIRYKCADCHGRCYQDLLALIFCHAQADFVFVKGHAVVQEGNLTTINLAHILSTQHLTAKLLQTNKKARS